MRAPVWQDPFANLREAGELWRRMVGGPAVAADSAVWTDPLVNLRIADGFGETDGSGRPARIRHKPASRLSRCEPELHRLCRREDAGASKLSPRTPGGIEPLLKRKGLRNRNSPSCTLSQNGYGSS